MGKIKKILFVLIVFIGLTGCSSYKTDDIDPNMLCGTWQSPGKLTNQNNFYIYNSDGTFTYYSLSISDMMVSKYEEVHGTYTVEGGGIHITPESGAPMVYAVDHLDENQMIYIGRNSASMTCNRYDYNTLSYHLSRSLN